MWTNFRKIEGFEIVMKKAMSSVIKPTKQQCVSVWQAYTQEPASLPKVEVKLIENDIVPRYYFYPSLDILDYLESKQVYKHSRGIASWILCLPIYPGLDVENVTKIIELVSNE
jgi:dTDP-4-amino-4,6-dideoxygalactose transaminase